MFAWYHLFCFGFGFWDLVFSLSHFQTHYKDCNRSKLDQGLERIGKREPTTRTRTRSRKALVILHRPFVCVSVGLQTLLDCQSKTFSVLLNKISIHSKILMTSIKILEMDYALVD